MTLERPRGVRDFPPKEMHEHLAVTKKLESVFHSFGYERVRTPTFEFLSLFEAKSGEEIKDHLYVFDDKGGRSLCLRPEATASVARMYGSDLRTHPKPLRLYYVEPMFRYEQPQRGRYREFWQAGVELIGGAGPYADAEAILMASNALTAIGLENAVRIGNIGFLRELLGGLGFDDAKQNKVIHALDKGEMDSVAEMVSSDIFNEVIGLHGGLDAIDRLLELAPDGLKASVEGFRKTIGLLSGCKVDYTVDMGMARGLDYYTGIVFDVKATGLGAQNQVCGGGRYDRLIGLFGGPETPAVGFAFGVDRLVEALNEGGKAVETPRCDVYVASVSEAVRERAFSIAAAVRSGNPGLDVRFDIAGYKVNKALQHASEVGARYALIVGERELAEDAVVVKNMESSTQETIGISGLNPYFSSKRAPD